ncbi:antitoxin MazE-like protein [Gordonia sp. (in: high G+C Gram-positive bacteria)]|uniref:antitoxin MazE-like protein n=1 Tax=Gordonia sp. (in: high G+C Gram-positive bacteria) TaxID=84139 RepID=UPI0039E26C62
MAVKDRVGEYRRRMRERGLRPLQMWVPDVRTEAFAAQARRQSAIVAGSETERDEQDFVESIAAHWDDGE